MDGKITEKFPQDTVQAIFKAPTVEPCLHQRNKKEKKKQIVSELLTGAAQVVKNAVEIGLARTPESIKMKLNEITNEEEENEKVLITDS